MSKIVRQLDDEGYYVGDAIANGHPKRPGEYILPGGAVDAPLPPVLTEGQRARWVDDAWQVVDPDPVVPPDPPTMEEKRAVAFLYRSEFCIAMKRAGYWTVAEAKSAGQGNVPPAFSAVLAASVIAGAITQDEADEAEITWATLQVVQRSHPVIPIAASVYSLTDAQIDALFGIT
ncbi:MAG: hypothetical protein AAF891_00045 [Pseudomonadota bacterium]